MKQARVFLLKGQYGIGSGMETLANMLRPYGTVSVHQWYDRDVIVGQARAFQTGGKDRVVAIIGYSLGGNQAPDYGDDLPSCDLTVSYDPSIYSPLAVNGVQPVSSKIRLAVCYFNTASWLARGAYGGARLSGRNVIERQFSGFHLTAHMRMDLHALSMGYVRATVNGTTVIAAK